MIRDNLIDFMNSYLASKKESFSEKNREENAKLIDVKDYLLSHLEKYENKYTMGCSVGQGRWAEVPWIAVYDDDITDSATRGYDIVYLFRADMKGVYLSLNQGVKLYQDKFGSDKIALEKIKIVSEEWQRMLFSRYDEYDLLNINLNKRKEANTPLPEGYENGHICGKYYPIDHIPSDKELMKDLDGLIKVYQSLKNILGNHISDPESVVNKILYYHENDINPNMIDDSDMSLINNAMDVVKVTGNPTEPPDSIKNHSHSIGEAHKSDFDGKHKKQKILGDLGENYVLNYEKDKLNELGLKDLAKKVKNVAKEEGDGKGYDILSFDPNTHQEMHIEVKTTKGKAEEPFYVTRNELEVSEKDKEKYYLYRVYNLNKNDKTFDFYVLRGSLNDLFELESTQYVVKGIK